MIRSVLGLILVLIAATAIAISVGGFSWDDGASLLSSGSASSAAIAG